METENLNTLDHKMDLPKVSFAFPVLNEEHNIERCVNSIKNQNYPEELVEIILADGGSTDCTVDIAEKYNCLIIDNPKKLAEPGAFLAHQIATGDIKVFLAADVVLPHKDWIREMVKPFIADKEVYGAFTHILPSPGDNSFNRYYSLLHVEPFSWFVYGYASDPKKYQDVYPIAEQNDSYTVFRFDLPRHPLIAFAQGFCLRKEFVRKEEYEDDDILPVIQMIEDGYKLAYVQNAGVYHFHLEGFRQYLKKFQWRIRNSLKGENAGFDRRRQYLSSARKLKKYIFVFYGCTFIGPLIDSFKWYMLDRERC